jgi:hypothetical protein
MLCTLGVLADWTMGLWKKSDIKIFEGDLNLVVACRKEGPLILKTFSLGLFTLAFGF